MRLDKFLTEMNIDTRSKVKALISKGFVKVNGVVIKDAGYKINTETDIVTVRDSVIEYKAFEYYMLNKPAGVVSATEDNRDTTVMDLIKDKTRKDLFPVGRLDKDTEGLLLITNDGELSHRLLSPKKHVDKTYFVVTDNMLSVENAKKLENGVDIGEDKLTLPAQISILEDKENQYLITIHEGKFHQVKRMFKAVGLNVIYLKRLSMGSLHLDESLREGEYRKLTEEEINSLKK